MKKLSIKEKAKAYDEVLERAKEKYSIFEGMKQGDVLEDVFLELKESEDERIRKGIIKSILDLNSDWLELHGVTKENAIAWLEKQSNKNEIDYNEELKKCKANPLYFFDKYVKVKLKEQKPVDKVEPKFHKGEWVTDGTSVFQIVKIESEWYIADDGERVCFDVVHQYYHLWTIQDAKVGDILVVKVREKPFIFKGLLDKFHLKSPVAYCGIGFENEFMIPAGVSWWTDEEVEPATKEQCDLLFSKMKEAGYEWNAEKKELKKIGQKPTENKDYSAPLDIEIPFGAKDSELIQETIRIPDGCYAFIEGNEIVIKKGEKPAWSEEDERMFNSALWHVKNSCSNGGKNSGEFEAYNWLKSLKDRIGNFDEGYKVGFSAAKYNQWKPSDKQMNTLEQWLKDNRYNGDKRYCYPIFDSLYQDLKKLREK